MTNLGENPMSGHAGASGGITRTRGTLSRLVVLATIILLLGQIVVAWLAVIGFERVLEPQLSRKADVVGRAIASQLEFVVDDLRIPPDELVAVNPFLDKILASNADIKYLIIQDSSSKVLFARGLSPEELDGIRSGLPEASSKTEVAGFINSVFPIAADDGVAAVLHVGVSTEYVRSRLSELLYEAITVVVVSLIVTLEFLIFLMSVRVSGPLERIERMLAEGARGIFGNRLAMRTRDEMGSLVIALNRALRGLRQRYEDFHFDMREIKDAQIDKNMTRRIQSVFQQLEDRYRFAGGMELRPRNAMQIRVPLFLFMFAEELPRSFLPLFIAQLSPTDTVISNELLFGLPIALFMLAGALTVPFGGRFADRFGARRVFLAGIVLATGGYFGTFFAQGYFDLIGWRILSGLGYGLIFIAAQAWVAENTREHSRAKDMSVFVGAVFAATICGPSIGGILAGRIGFEATFLVSAALAVISGSFVYAMLDGTAKHGLTTPRTSTIGREWQALFSDGRLFAVTVFAAVPGKLILAGFLFYLVPLYLSELGHRPSVIGWMIMLYGVSTFACMPFAARFADRSSRHGVVVGAGGVIAGLGCLGSLFDTAVGGATGAVMVAIVTLGIGHALSLASQLAIVQEVSNRYQHLGQASIIGAYRLVERIGMVLGPVAAATLAATFGYRGAIVGIGVLVLISIAFYMIVMHLSGNAPAARRRKVA